MSQLTVPVRVPGTKQMEALDQARKGPGVHLQPIFLGHLRQGFEVRRGTVPKEGLDFPEIVLETGR